MSKHISQIEKNLETVSVILPSYNERDNIVEAINRISKSLGEQLLEIMIGKDISELK